jgi:hypothetical protein
MAAFAALALGAIVAVFLDAALTVGTSYLYSWLGINLTLIRVLGAVIALIIGAVVGGATLISRPAGPIVPVIAGVLALAAGFVGDVIGVVAYSLLRGDTSVFETARRYVESYAHIDAIGVIILLLTPIAAAGLSAVRHLRNPGGPRQQAAGAWGAPYGGQFPPPQPGFQQPPGYQQQPGVQQQPGYQQPGMQQPWGGQQQQQPGGPFPPPPSQGSQPPYGQPGAQPPPPA